MYVNQVLSDYIMRHNKEYQELNPVSLDYNDTLLEELGLKSLKDSKYIFSGEIYYKTNFNKFCNNKTSNVLQLLGVNIYKNY